MQRKAHLNQCTALTNAAGLRVSKTIEIPGTTATDHKLIKYLDVAKAIVLCLVAFFHHPMPRNTVVLCSGRSISLLVWLWKKLTGRSFLSIYVGHAKSPMVFYDMMIIPEHDVPLMMARRRPSQSVEVVKTTGILTVQMRDPSQKNADTVLACIGGDNITFSYTGEAFKNFLSRLKEISKTHTLKIAVSGRTTNKIRQLIERDADLRSAVIEAHDRGGFVLARDQANSIFVCPDSVTMISEALALGATVYVPHFEVLNTQTSDFFFVSDCRLKRYVLDDSSFPAANPPRPFPDSLAQAVPYVLDAVRRWKRSLG